MKNLKHIFLFIFLLFIYYAPVKAQNKKSHYSFEKTIHLPGNGGHDYLYINPATQKLYVTHGSNLDVINLKNEKFIGAVKGLGEIHGVAIDNKLHRGFVSDNHKRAVDVFNPKTLKVVKFVHLKGVDEDATLLDPTSGDVFVFEGDSHQAEVVNPKTMKEVHIIPLGAKPEFAVSNGNGLIFNNLQSANKIAVINVHTMKIVKKYDLGPCGAPTALALDKKNHRLFTGCRKNEGLTVVNSKTGKVIQTLPIGAGVDAVKYDPETHLVFASCYSGTMTIIKEESPNKYKIAQLLKTEKGARTMALDHKTHSIYLSVEKYKNGNHHEVVPNSFKVLVYHMK